ncbi:TetR/AcrR family transcriptional regulator [Sphingomonas sp.]|uniref:TetR/AcrR family transcriptional regulator n=1 Tax=Sphingomonas sp. TaxID=28214 RepID=UPI003B3B587A
MRTRARIIAAAFELLGEEAGLYARVEEVAARAGITRATFYDHFTGMAELREALTYELTHVFMIAVSEAAATLDDPRERASAATRLYLERVQRDRHWAWSMVNLSASGFIFGAETFHQAQTTIQEGIAARLLTIPEARLGRDLWMGACFAAMVSMLREEAAADYPRNVACRMLMALGVSSADAEEISNRPLPAMPGSTASSAKLDNLSD